MQIAFLRKENILTTKKKLKKPKKSPKKVVYWDLHVPAAVPARAAAFKAKIIHGLNNF